MLPGATPVGAVDLDAGYGPVGIDDGTDVSDGGVGAALEGDASSLPVDLFHQEDDDDEEEDEEDDEDEEEEDDDEDDEDEEEEDDDEDEEEEDDDGILGLFNDDGDDDGDGEDGDEGDPDGGDDEGDGDPEAGSGDGDSESNPTEPSSAGSNEVGAGDGPADLPQAETPTATPTATTGTPAPEGFRVENVTVNRTTVTAGEPVRVTATVVNGWSSNETRRIHLRMFGETVDSRSVTVPANSAREVSFVRRIAAPGTYEVNVREAGTEVTVVAAEGSASASPPSGLPEVTRIETPGFTSLAALVGLLGALLVARRRGRD